MATPVDPQTPEASRRKKKKGHVRLVDVSPRDEDQGPAQGPRQSVWTAMDEETLRILLDVEKTYRRLLGPDHALTADARRRIQMLRDRTPDQNLSEKTSV